MSILHDESVNLACCRERVATYIGMWPHFHQCRKKWKVERDGKRYCKIHDPVEVKKREIAKRQRFEAKFNAESPKWYAHEMLELLQDSVGGISGTWKKRRDSLLMKFFPK